MIESAKERMEVLARVFGLSLNEEFNIKGSNYNPHKVTERGLLDCDGDQNPVWLQWMLLGDASITKRPKAPWKPKEDERYWYVTPRGIVKAMTFHPSMSGMDDINYGIGNCFPDKETAEANKDIILQKFNAPELTPASWTPACDGSYWCIYNDEPMELLWNEDTSDYERKAVGNLYRTEAEALADYPNLRKRLGMPEVNA